MSQVKEFLKNTFEITEIDAPIRSRVQCKDGFSLSIQASRFHYCVPRRTLANGCYTHVGAGFVSEYEELLEEYREGTIYPYVPIEVMDKVLDKHGGLL